ncbi:MAG: ISKra4 family transposase, partial [Streptosporangiaceae bacterium]
MAEYCAVPPDDPFAVSRGMFTALASGLAGPAAAGLTACELEELLGERGREVLRQLLQDHFD